MNIKYIYRLLFTLLIIQVAFYLYGLIGRGTDIDDAWIGEQSYWISKDGVARSELMRGWHEQEERTLIHHKLLTLTGTAFIKLFGFSVYSLKSVSLFFFIIFIFVFIYYTRIYKKIFNQRQLIIAMLILFIYHYVFKFTFIFRPEILIMLLAFITFILLEKINHNQGNLIVISILAGISAGLCGVAHLNGLVVPAAGFSLLLLSRKWKSAPGFLGGVIIGFSLYFYDFTREYNLSFWKYQLMESVIGNETDSKGILIYFIHNLGKEHMRFFHDLGISSFSIFMITLLLSGSTYLKQKHKFMMGYTVLLIFFTAIAFSQKSRQYTLIYFPYLLIMLTIIYDAFLNRAENLHPLVRTTTGKVWILFSALLFVGGSTIFNYRVAQLPPNTQKNHSIASTYIKGDHSVMNIVAPMEFIFNEIEYFNRIQGERFYTTLRHSDSTIRGKKFLDETKKYNIDYILLSSSYSRELEMNIFAVNDTVAGYRIIFQSNNLSILKKNHKMPSSAEIDSSFNYRID